MDSVNSCIHGEDPKGAAGWVEYCLHLLLNRDCCLFSGLRLEGVYRKGGARARSLRLLAEFRRDARSVKLRPREHFVEDVTDTLKRFFRELDDPVTSARLLPRWREAAGTSMTHPRSHLPLSVPTKFSCGTGQSLSQHSPSWWSPRN